MKKIELQKILNEVPDDYDICFEAEMCDRSISLYFDQHDINEDVKRLYIILN